MADLRQLLSLPSDLDDKSTKLLLKAIKENNKDGFDYLEFLISVDKLKKMDMDEATAMKSAYATASAFGLNKNELVSSGQYYIGILRQEYEAFKSALARQIDKKLSQPEERMKKMLQEQVEIDDQVKKLLARKEKLGVEAEKLKARLESNREDLKLREQKFNDTFNRIKEAIEEDITNINDQL